MSKKHSVNRARQELEKELEELRHQLDEANETIDAIRTGQIDAIVVQGERGHQLYTLKSADHTYRVFIEKMTEGAVTLNVKGLILFCNTQFTRMVDKPLSQIIGLSFENFIDEESLAAYHRLFEQCWGVDCKGEVLLISGREKIPVQLSLTTLELDEGISLSIILTDLTLQKETQKQLTLNNRRLEEINKALEVSNHDLQQFASVASHDLQEPLRKIQMFSDIIRDRGTALDPQLKTYLHKIVVSAGRMKALIVDILNYSKLSADDHPLECVDLKELVLELLEDFELLIHEKKASVHVADLPCMDVNRGQIRQVFQNLISNALKFSRKDVPPEIRISSRCLKQKSFDSETDDAGAYCLISIKDNGIGFDEKYITHVFALFERLNSKDKYEGTGIGLAIAKKIIDKHDGLITARSTEGEGAEFQIILPLSQAGGAGSV